MEQQQQQLTLINGTEVYTPIGPVTDKDDPPFWLFQAFCSNLLFQLLNDSSVGAGALRELSRQFHVLKNLLWWHGGRGREQRDRD